MARGQASEHVYDYIIIGAGSAGCVLANRLSEDADVKVLLLEAGREDRHLWLKIPLKFRDLMTHKSFNWGYNTEPEPYMDGRSVYLPRGKVLGGSSSINGLMYCRCHPRDYEQWRQMGLTGWGYSDVLPYFKRSEDFPGGESLYHGAGGPLGVQNGDRASPAHLAYIQAGRNAGYLITDDHNTLANEGFGPADQTIRDGRRSSTARAFLKPARKRPNLTVATHAHANKVVMDGGRAVGVEYRRRGAVVTARAEREVIVSGGAYNSPQILMLSGIGPADELAKHGIAVQHDAPQVGKNLQDHIHVGVAYNTDKFETYHRELRADRLTLAVLNWLLFKKGHLTRQPIACLAYIRTRPELDRPDLELLMGRVNPQSHIWFPGIRKPREGYLGCRPTLLHPESRGTVTLRSGHPEDKAAIRHNYLAAEFDRRTMRDGVKAARELYATAPLKDLIAGDEVFPGKGIKTDAEIDEYVRRTAITMYHPTSTCRMGTDPGAVVNGELKVNGVAGLRVVDASVMPLVPGGHTNAPTIMIAEKAADMILGRKAPEPIEVPALLSATNAAELNQGSPCRHIIPTARSPGTGRTSG